MLLCDTTSAAAGVKRVMGINSRYIDDDRLLLFAVDLATRCALLARLSRVDRFGGSRWWEQMSRAGHDHSVIGDEDWIF